ncbi:dTDP-4-dehydrorhamnose 3,5-epimerase [Pelomonas sp. SE-A7]|uniref:dTDP-4-dehydrorhamnose 3,5-epimerase n=1 Tax=Pelomonas sp. SE-A7 TaxID=3054953 RepID=UPI00259CF968|nr:dTDP-4-dehydrorhamnose 3,5-epimerase [Pelomonas sp. SE-A7]MDM4766034.1 dTDP-4-dehydrorhamnose 3,5-epimerase [Pelomonas sp. SE-A7]
MSLKATPTALPEVFLIEPRVFGDARGFFTESWNEQAFNAATGNSLPFVQDNHSRSSRGVLRGLHFQLPPHAQGKLVRVVSGAVFDVAVDLRRSSPRFGQWVGFELSADNHRQMWIPPGFAHGFLVLSESADFLYKTTDFYSPQSEGAVRWDDPAIGIQWPDVGVAPLLADKDRVAPVLGESKAFE